MKVALPNEAELSRLPRAAMSVFTAQCLRRIAPVVGAISPCKEVHAAFGQAIKIVESDANGHLVAEEDCDRLSLELTRLWNSAHEYVLSSDPAFHLRRALEAAELGVCIPSDALNNRSHLLAADVAMSIESALKASAIASSVSFSDVGFHYERLPEAREIREDFELLLSGFEVLEPESQIITPAQFFDLHCRCDEGSGTGAVRVPDVVQVATSALLDRCALNPEEVNALASRDFEALVAELMERFGFTVELTKRTRDGGRDVIAVCRRPFDLRFLIECKRYARGHKVGVAIVRALHGVVLDDRGTKGIIVTTSGFTKPAREHLDRHRWLLEGRDFDGLVEWLALCRDTRFRRKWGDFLTRFQGQPGEILPRWEN